MINERVLGFGNYFFVLFLYFSQTKLQETVWKFFKPLFSLLSLKSMVSMSLKSVLWALETARWNKFDCGLKSWGFYKKVCFKAGFYEFLPKENSIFEKGCLLLFNRNGKNIPVTSFCQQNFLPNNWRRLKWHLKSSPCFVTLSYTKWIIRTGAVVNSFLSYLFRF